MNTYWFIMSMPDGWLVEEYEILCCSIVFSNIGHVDPVPDLFFRYIHAWFSVFYVVVLI